MRINHTIAEETKKSGQASAKKAEGSGEAYERQFNTGVNFYNNLLRLFTGSDAKGSLDNIFKPYQFFNGAGPIFFANPFIPVADNLSRQTMSYNNSFFAMMSGAMVNAAASEISRKCKHLNELQIEACGNILNVHSQAFNKQLGFSMEVAVKATEEMHDLFAAFVKQHQKSWAEPVPEAHMPPVENSKKTGK
jgi:hypothetical protein